MRLSQLRNAKIRTLDGETIGRVHEIHSEGWRIVMLVCGPGSFIESLTGKSRGRRIPWECVKRISGTEVIVAPDPPQGKPVKRRAAARSPRGTRRSSGPQSKR